MEQVVTHNDFIAKVYFRGLSLQEERVMVTAISRINDKGGDTVVINYRDFCRLANINPKDRKQAHSFFIKVLVKLNQVHVINEDENGWEGAPLFKLLRLDKKTGEVSLQINERAEPMFNNLSSQFTVFSLEEHNSFNSSYTTVAFRHLMQFKSTGKWIVSVEDFRKYLDIPESYTMAIMTRRVLKPIMEELTEYFDGNFEVRKIAGKSDGKRGRRPITTLEFLFTAKETKKKPPKDVTPPPVWKQDWYLAMTKEEQRDFEDHCRQRKIEEDAEKQEKMSILISAGASEMEINMGMQYLDDGDIESYSMVVDIARKRTGKTAKKKKEKKNTPPPVDAHYSDEVIADNLPF